MSAASISSAPFVASGGMSVVQRVSRLFRRLARPVRGCQVGSLRDLSEAQLRDIGVGPAITARIADMRALESFGGPHSRTWVLLMHRGPGT